MEIINNGDCNGEEEYVDLKGSTGWEVWRGVNGKS